MTARVGITAGVVTAVAVVLAARGYPEAAEHGSTIRRLAEAAGPDVRIFHAGTQAGEDGAIRAAGGRVLTVCGTGPTLRHAREAAYAAVDRIEWPEGFCRRDIGAASS